MGPSEALLRLLLDDDLGLAPFGNHAGLHRHDCVVGVECARQILRAFDRGKDHSGVRDRLRGGRPGLVVVDEAIVQTADVQGHQ